MSSLQPVQVLTYDGVGVSTGAITLEPKSSRNGVFQFEGSESTPTLLPADTRLAFSASVRPGRAHDFSSGQPRIKQKTILKARVPVEVPGLVAGSVGDVVDYVDVELTIAQPVETGADVIETVKELFSVDDGIFDTDWINDMIANGREPY